MADRGSRVRAAGLALTLVAVGAGFGSRSTSGFVLSFAGVLIGANRIAGGVLMADAPGAPVRPVVLAGARALVGCISRNLAVAGILVASSAVTAVAGETTAPVACLCAFALLLLGLSLVGVKVLGGID
ncbi:hypothetical protein BS78_07G065500 [Paspalum vaginatum]|nr:hypothetical protein BS78_07G065500 [Paspalum vaginatum]